MIPYAAMLPFLAKAGAVAGTAAKGAGMAAKIGSAAAKGAKAASPFIKSLMPMLGGMMGGGQQMQQGPQLMQPGSIDLSPGQQRLWPMIPSYGGRTPPSMPSGNAFDDLNEQRNREMQRPMIPQMMQRGSY